MTEVAMVGDVQASPPAGGRLVGALGNHSEPSSPVPSNPTRTWELRLLAALAVSAPFNLTLGVEPWTALRLRPLEVIGLGVCVLLAVSAVRQRRLDHYDVVDLCCGWWLIGVWLAALTSVSPVLGSSGAIRISIAALLVFVTRRLVAQPGAGAFVLRALAVGCVAGAALGLALVSWSSVDTTTWFVGQVTLVGTEPRLTHPWAHANIAAMGIVISGAGVAAMHRRGLAVVAMVVLVLALASTASRGGIVAALAIALTWVWVRKSAREAIVIVVLVLLAGVMIATTDVWRTRILTDADQLGYSVELGAPDRLIAGDGPVWISATNSGTTAWQNTGRQEVLLSARWVDQTGSILAEDWWPLPESVPVGESIEMLVAVESRAPVGVYQLRWDMIVPNVAYFAQSAAQPPTVTNVVVATSSINPEAVASYARARSQVQLGRIDTWRLAWTEFVDSPVVGTGPNQFGQSSQTELAGTSRVAGSHAHNIVLQPLVGWGLVGALPFLLLVGHAVFGAAAQLRSRRGLHATIVFVSLVALLTHGLVDWPLVSVSTCIPVGIVLGLGLRNRRAPETAHESFVASD